MMTSTQRSLIGLAAVLTFSAVPACGSDSSEPGSPAGSAAGAMAQAGAAGAMAQAGAAGAPVSGSSGSGSGGSTGLAGAPAAGAPGAGGGAAGSSAAGGSAGGASGGGQGGSSSGAGGASGGSTSGSATFAQVANLFSTSCAGGMCHGAGSKQVNLTDMAGLYGRLTTPLPSTIAFCKGTTLVVKNDAAGSFLANIVKAKSSCMNDGAMQMVARMPDDCSTTSSSPRRCLTTEQAAIISNWIAAGAPM